MIFKILYIDVKHETLKYYMLQTKNLDYFSLKGFYKLECVK